MRTLDGSSGMRVFLWVRRLLLLLCAPALVALGGCAQQPERAASSPWTLATSTMLWNQYACELIARNQVGQFPASRVLAYVNLGINNGIVAARQQGRSTDGAAAGAAASMLAYFFPKDEQAIAGRLAGEVAAMGDNGRRDFSAGVDIGRSAATDVVASAKADRSDLAWDGPLPTEPTRWSSRAQPARRPLGPRLGEMRTFFLASGADFRAPAPPAYDSPEFRKQVMEIRTISDARTSEQVRIAQFWEGLMGSFNAGYWNGVARDAIAAHDLDEARSARVLALVHMASVDATIACHDSKYTYWVARPTQADPAIRLAIGVPNHPSYPSNHACISGTIGRVLDAQFPGRNGRYYAMALQAADSRMYAGIHYRMDIDEGLVIANKVAERAVTVGIPADRPFVAQGK